MAKFKSMLILTVSPLLAGGCAHAPAPVVTHQADSAFLQVDDEHFIKLTDVRQVQFSRIAMPGAPDSFSIELDPSSKEMNSELITYSKQAPAYEAWVRVVNAIGGKLHDEKWVPTPIAAPASKTKAQPEATSQPVAPTAEDDEYAHLSQQLAWLMKCVDAKLLTDAEYQQGRAWAIAELQGGSRAQGGGGGVFQTAPSPNFEHLYQQLVGLAKSKDSGLLTDEEAAKVRVSIVKQAGLVE